MSTELNNCTYYSDEDYNSKQNYSAGYIQTVSKPRYSEYSVSRNGLPFFNHREVREPVKMIESDAWAEHLNTPFRELTPVVKPLSPFINRAGRLLLAFFRKTRLMRVAVYLLYILTDRQVLLLAYNTRFKEILMTTENVPLKRAIRLMEYMNFEACLQITLFLSEKRMFKLITLMIKEGYTPMLGRIADSSPDVFFIKTFAKLGEQNANVILQHITRPERFQMARKLGQSIEDLPVALAELMNIRRELELNNSALQKTVDALEISKQREEAKSRELNQTVSELENLTRRIRTYVPSQLVESILGGSTETMTHKRKKITLFFSDIAGFTEIADNTEAETLAEFLNSYLDEMSAIAGKYGGTIDKFIGDAIVIFFGDPETAGEKEDALNCVRMAHEMQQRLHELRDEWSDKGFKYGWNVRMGINTGYCTVGDFGSENRKDYTVIGREVNLAARLEAAAPVDGILLSHSTYSLIRQEYHCSEEAAIQVKGFQKPVLTYLLHGLRQAEKNNRKLNLPGFQAKIDLSRIEESDRNYVIARLNELINDLEDRVG